MNGSRSWLGVVLGGAGFAGLLAIDRVGSAYALLILGLLFTSIRWQASLNLKILLGAGAGLAWGYTLQTGFEEGPRLLAHIGGLDVAGSLFILALKMLIAPMIFLSITFGIAQMAAARDLGRVGARTVGLYVLTMVFAIGTGLVLVNLIQPGADSGLLETAFFQETVGSEAAQGITKPEGLGPYLLETLFALLQNPIRSLAAGSIMPIILFALLLGIALLQIGSSARPLIDVIGGGYQAIMRIIGWIILMAPVGVFALLGELTASADLQELVKVYAAFFATVIPAILFHAFVTLPLVLWVLTRISPVAFFRGVGEAMLVAFSTSSSAATLPVTTRCVEDNMGVPKHVSSFVLPLGATVNMDGTALYEAIAAIFIANIYGIDIPLGSQVILFLVAMLTAIGAPAIPSAGMVTMVVVLEALGLPGEAVGLLLPVDRFLDTFRTMANVEGDSMVAIAIARSEA